MAHYGVIGLYLCGIINGPKLTLLHLLLVSLFLYRIWGIR